MAIDGGDETQIAATSAKFGMGDTLRVTLRDSSLGLLALVEDLSTGQFGFLFAGPNAGFGQVDYDPAARTCTVTPYAFRPMYSTSSENTGVPWAAHSGNVTFSDEIGHFEYCDAFNTNSRDPNYLRCIKAGADEPDGQVDADDISCRSPAFFGFSLNYIQVSGCRGSDFDFDGPAYRENWPGTGRPWQDESLHPTAIQFSSPRFTDAGGTLRNYERMAFETDLPAFTRTCDTRTGQGCKNLPGDGVFYPLFSTMPNFAHQCVWQLGGPTPPGLLDNFGGTVASEYGDLATQAYPGPFGAFFRLNVYRRIINNPCQGFGPL